MQWFKREQPLYTQCWDAEVEQCILLNWNSHQEKINLNPVKKNWLLQTKLVTVNFINLTLYPGVTTKALIFLLAVALFFFFAALIVCSREACNPWGLKASMLSNGCRRTTHLYWSLAMVVRVVQRLCLWLPGMPLKMVMIIWKWEFSKLCRYW